MKWLDALFGRPRVPASRLDALFAISTARVTLEANLGLRWDERAAVVLRGVESSYYEGAERELDQLLGIALKETGTASTRQRDAQGFEWLVLRDEELEDVVAAAHMVGQTLQAHGFLDRLLAALFAFRGADDRVVYWVYNYKRGTFYPFAPRDGRARDYALELRLAAVMKAEMPIEPATERWYALWDPPL
ncbi:MAG TPA: hypothetical protein VFC93_07935 [Chloroflexota bacterium]|nr:hypothetical protein [Chloroflexota bacterium]